MICKTKNDHTSYPSDIQEDSTGMDLHLLPNTAFFCSNEKNNVNYIDDLLHSKSDVSTATSLHVYLLKILVHKYRIYVYYISY